MLESIMKLVKSQRTEIWVLESIQESVENIAIYFLKSGRQKESMSYALPFLVDLGESQELHRTGLYLIEFSKWLSNVDESNFEKIEWSELNSIYLKIFDRNCNPIAFQKYFSVVTNHIFYILQNRNITPLSRNDFVGRYWRLQYRIYRDQVFESNKNYAIETINNSCIWIFENDANLDNLLNTTYFMNSSKDKDVLTPFIGYLYYIGVRNKNASDELKNNAKRLIDKYRHIILRLLFMPYSDVNIWKYLNQTHELIRKHEMSPEPGSIGTFKSKRLIGEYVARDFVLFTSIVADKFDIDDLINSLSIDESWIFYYSNTYFSNNEVNPLFTEDFSEFCKWFSIPINQTDDMHRTIEKVKNSILLAYGKIKLAVVAVPEEDLRNELQLFVKNSLMKKDIFVCTLFNFDHHSIDGTSEIFDILLYRIYRDDLSLPDSTWFDFGINTISIKLLNIWFGKFKNSLVDVRIGEDFPIDKIINNQKMWILLKGLNISEFYIYKFKSKMQDYKALLDKIDIIHEIDSLDSLIVSLKSKSDLIEIYLDIADLDENDFEEIIKTNNDKYCITVTNSIDIPFERKEEAVRYANQLMCNIKISAKIQFSPVEDVTGFHILPFEKEEVM